MRRRYVVLLEVLVLAVLLVWAVASGVSALAGHSTEGIDLKIQLDGAEDRALLVERDDGTMHYRIRTDSGVEQWLSPEEFARRVHRDQRSRGAWEVLLNVSSPAGFAWVAIGFLGQLLFTGRMVVQWLVSERSKRSVVPPVFWWMSLIGASMLLVYFIWRKEPIGVLGQATGWFIYVRNLWMIYRQRDPQKSPAAS
ncbi:MAG: lipid-A-disaccharide synthase N-terminal domain-containing protein [Planctomycetota bacterium]